MTEYELLQRILAIIDRAEYGGRMAGISKATRSSKRAREAAESADISARQARQMAAQLAQDVAR